MIFFLTSPFVSLLLLLLLLWNKIQASDKSSVTIIKTALTPKLDQALFYANKNHQITVIILLLIILLLLIVLHDLIKRFTTG